MENKQYFYTITRDGKFINSNHDKEDTDNIPEAIRFLDEKNLLRYWESSVMQKMRVLFDMKKVKVECISEEFA